MTAAELRALIAGATKAPWFNSECGDINAGVSGPICDFVPRSTDRALIVALVNNADRFAELLAAEEAKAGTITWERDSDYPSDPTDYNAIQHGEVVGWVWKTPLGGWLGNTQLSGGGGSHYSTEAEARAAVEAAVRAGR